MRSDPCRPFDPLHPTRHLRQFRQPGNGQVKHPGTWDPRIISICCRYLNSGIPVLVGTREHAFVLCGYRRRPQQGNPDWIEFIRQEDQVGPYLVVDNVFEDFAAYGYRYSPWQVFIVPMPEKLWLPPEPAEGLGARLLDAWARTLAPSVPETGELLRLQDAGDLAYRTYAVDASDFKAGLLGRRVPEALQRAYRLARLPRFLWVVEAIDRTARRSGSPDCVLGKVIFDSTSSELEPASCELCCELIEARLGRARTSEFGREKTLPTALGSAARRAQP